MKSKNMKVLRKSMKFREIKIIERDSKKECNAKCKHNNQIKNNNKKFMKKEVKEKEFKVKLIKCKEIMMKYIIKLNKKQRKKLRI